MADANTMSAIDASLKEAYPIDYFEKQFSEQKELYKKIEKLSASNFAVIDMGGRRSVIPIMKGRIAGGGWRAENTALPQARSLQPANLYVSNKNIYHRAYITGQVLEMAKQNWEAFVPELELLTTSMDESIKKKFNFGLYRDSTGSITQITTGVTNSTTVVVDSLKGLYVDMPIDVFTTQTGGTQEVTAATITDIAEDTNTLTLDAQITCSTSSYVFEAGDQNNALDGLFGNLATTGTVHGVDKAGTGNGWWKGNLINSTSKAIADADLKLLKTAALKANDTEPGRFWLTTYEVADQVWDKLLRPDRRNNDAVIAGGVETFKYHGYPFVCENDCPKGKIVLVDPTKVKLLRVSDFNFIMNAGSIQHPVSGYDAVELTLRSYCNLLVTYPKAVPYSTGFLEA